MGFPKPPAQAGAGAAAAYTITTVSRPLVAYAGMMVRAVQPHRMPS